MTPIASPSVLLLGAPGSGKTYSISTILAAGLDTHCIITEPNGLETLLDVVEKKNLPLEKLHWKVITPARAGFAGLIAGAEKIARMDFKQLADQKPSGQRQTSQFVTLLETMQEFRCDHCGKSFGPVTAFDSTQAVVVDSLSGLNLMAMDMVIGDKVTAHQGEWGVAMKMLDRFILNCTSNLSCLFVLTSHLEREIDEVAGGSRIMAATLGKKLAPQLPRFFSDVVMAYREGDKYLWSTNALNVDLKHRSLPLSGKLEPSFAPIIAAAKRRTAFAATKSQQSPAALAPRPGIPLGAKAPSGT